MNKKKEVLEGLTKALNLSPQLHLDAGVPQGCVLGPLPLTLRRINDETMMELTRGRAIWGFQSVSMVTLMKLGAKVIFSIFKLKSFVPTLSS